MLTKIKLGLLAIVLATGAFIISKDVFAVSGIIPVYVGSESIQYKDAIPYLSDADRVMLPFRIVGESLEISFDWKEKNVIAKGYNVETGATRFIEFTPGLYTMRVDGQSVAIDETLTLKDGRSYIPIRVFAESFGYNVEWKNKSVYITNPNVKPELPPIAEPEPPIVQPIEPPVEPTPTPPTIEPLPPVEPPTSNIGAFQQDVLRLVNIEREKVNLKPLQHHDAVGRVAQVKSEDMSENNYLEHTSPTHGTPFEMLKNYGISYKSAGENIAQGYRTPQEVVTGWMNSSGHRANILHNRFTHIGIGYAQKGHYWAQIFITP